MKRHGYLEDLANFDLQLATTLCVRLYNAEPQESFAHHCNATLNHALGNVRFSAVLYQLHPFKALEHDTRNAARQWIPSLAGHALDQPCANRVFPCPVTDVGTMPNEPALVEMVENPPGREPGNKAAGQNKIWIVLRNNNELLACVYSCENSFTDNELAMMLMLQPNLEMAWVIWQKMRAMAQELDHVKNMVFQPNEIESCAALIRKMLDALTSRQQDVVELVATGMDNQQIADELDISVKTVKKHLQIVFRTLEVHHRTELAAKWNQAHSIVLY